MVLMRSLRSFAAVFPPTVNSSPTGSGHIFFWISSGNRVWTLSGFSKSLAIFASSLFRLIPTLTVKPSVSRIRSLSSCAIAIGSG